MAEIGDESDDAGAADVGKMGVPCVPGVTFKCLFGMKQDKVERHFLLPCSFSLS